MLSQTMHHTQVGGITVFLKLACYLYLKLYMEHNVHRRRQNSKCYHECRMNHWRCWRIVETCRVVRPCSIGCRTGVPSSVFHALAWRCRCSNTTSHIIIIIIIITVANWDKPSRHEDIRKEMKITNCNRLAGSERALEWDRISPL